MIILAKIALIIILLWIAYQDIKPREVYWFLFPAVAIFGGLLFYAVDSVGLQGYSVLINLMVITMFLLIIHFYVKLKMGASLISVIGLGDVLLFIALGCSFTSMAFILTFVFSLIFALVLHLYLSKKQHFQTVPLAGYMSIFYAVIYLTFWSGLSPNLYSL